MGIPLASAADEVTVNGQIFTRVEEELTWDDALKYCRVYHTDLANLESLYGRESIADLYFILTSNPAWIGLFFDVKTDTLSWSSGSIFTRPLWLSSIPVFEAGLCALLRRNILPIINAAYCSTQHSFICYYDPAIGHLGTTKSPFSDPLKPDEVQIGNQLFIRISEELKTWTAAHQYCQTYYTDLANLQSVTEGALLKPITSEAEAWIGLIFDVNSQSLKWSSDFGSKIPEWLLVPMFSSKLCASLSRQENFVPRITSAVCDALKPFICFYDLTNGHLDPMENLLTTSSRFPQSHEVSTPLTPDQLGTTWSPSFDSGSSIARAEGTLTAPSMPPGNSTVSDCTTTTGQELSTVTRHMPPASPQPTGSPSKLQEVTSQASRSGSGNLTPGMSIPPLTSTSRLTTRLGSTQRQSEPEPGSISVMEQKVTGTSTEPPGSPLSPRSEQRFVILKADFNSPAALEPEDRKEQFLREIQEAVKVILGHEQFRLKWISSEEKEN